MRRLILMRHAKSDWSAGEPDHGRPLNHRGRRDAPRIATHLAELGWVPDLVLASDSQRTRETWDRMSRVLSGPIPVRTTRALYLAGLGALQDEAARLPETVRTVLALGHNPGWEAAAGRLAGAPIRMTTANAALFELGEVGWEAALEAASPRLLTVLRPKELP
jgi:phosphohistidine phosphatase